jgi:DNA-binding beta-propeller fold protein YncE
MISVIVASLALLAPQRGTPLPTRDVSDPGVIATGQRTTPVGVQTVFTGKVGGVRFGASSDEIWVAVPNIAYHLDWRANRVIAQGRIDGRPGVYGVTIDPVTQRAFVTSVSRLPAAMANSRMPGGEPLPRNGIVARVAVFESAAKGDTVFPAFSSGPLGDYMAGAPAVAKRAGADGHRVAAVPLPANDALAIVDAETGSLLRMVPLGVEPIAAVVSADGSVAYVSVLGGAKPTPKERAALQCCDPRAEAVRVDARGIAAPGDVSRVDLAQGTVTRTISVGRHPTAIAWNETRKLLYVAAGNSDSISVIDTDRDAVARTIAITPFRERKIGLSPTALALTPDGRTLFVALGGVNAVAVYDVSAANAKLNGLIPTAWYPASLDVSADGKYLAIGALLGVGSGNGTIGAPRLTGRYVFSLRGSVNVVPIPSPSELVAYTTAVAQNNRLALAGAPERNPTVVRTNVPARAVPERPGEASLIKHVVFIVKENRTYDQVLGDLGRGAGDSSLVIYGRAVTPNQHALAEQFVTIDHFFASGGNSADGHQWLTQANETEYPMWPLYFGRSYPSEGEDALTYSSGGFLWESAQAKGRRVVIFGEYAPSPKTASARVRDSLFALYQARPNDASYLRSLLVPRFNTKSDIPSLDRALVREYPGWTQEVPDVVKAGNILAHLADWEAQNDMPALTMVILPNDHTEGTSQGWCTPKACVADNDLGFGKIVEGLSHSRFWKDMAILAVEDDAQDGVDHIDGHRTTAFVASPYAKRGVVDSTFYSQPSMVKTVELMLGLPALSLFDLVATDMRASFIGPNEQPDFTPYTAIEPKQSLLDKNVRVGSIIGPFARERKRAAEQSARMSFAGPDEAPSDLLNRILWWDARGWGTPYPGVKHSVFFPMSVDIPDEDREDAKAKKKKDR